ncbi:MAG: hypothetical protein ACRDJT_11285 [Actinomycetota bacterium]
MKALVRLLRWPSLAGAVFVSAAILVCATAVAPLFLARSGAAIFQDYADAQGEEGAVTIANDGAFAADVANYRDGLVVDTAPDQLGEPRRTMIGAESFMQGQRGGYAARPIFRTGALDHVEQLTDGPARGVWISSFLAKRMDAGPGDIVTLGSDPSVDVEVAGVFRDLLELPRSDYWSPLDNLIYQRPTEQLRPPDPLVVDRATFFEIENALGDFRGESRWEFPVDAGNMTLGEATEAATATSRWAAILRDPTTEPGAAMLSANFVSLLRGWADLAEKAVTSISGPVDMLAFGGQAVALLVIAGSGFFIVGRRRTEFMLLHARGIGPLRLGFGAAVEGLLPVAAGAAAGGAIAWLFLEAAGPDGLFGRAVAFEAARAGAIMAGASLLLLGASVALAVRAQAHEGFGRVGRSAARVPWELLILVLAAASLYELLTRGVTPVEGLGDAVPRMDRLVILFPILFLTGAAGLASRALRHGLPRLRAAGGRWPPALYVATRRLASTGRSAAALVTAATVAIGMFAYSAIISSSAEATASQKSLIRVGSSVSASISAPPEVLDSAGFDNTPVIRYTGARLGADVTDAVDVIAVDPATFDEAAFWDSRFSDVSLEELLTRIDGDTDDGVPVVVAGSAPDATLLQISSYEVPIEVVGRAETFPGVLEGRPLIVVAREPLTEALAANDATLRIGEGDFQVWGNGTPSEMNTAFVAAGESVHTLVSAAELRDTPPFLALTWTFGLLEALGVLIGLVTLVGMFLYLQTRQREQQVSYALGARMGLERGSHRLSIGIEMTGMLGASVLLGLVLAIIVTVPTHDHIQVFSDPGSVPLVQIPAATLALAAAVVLAAAWMGAWFVQREADRTDVAQVMRLAR